MMDARLAAEVWKRLIAGKSLEELGLSTSAGRIDLRGLRAPEPAVLREYSTPIANVTERGNLVRLRGVQLRGIDFSKSRLDSLRLFDAIIEDCSFDEARCEDWRMWGTSISNTTFRGTNLRHSALGGVDDGKRNSFHKVDFTRADLRQTAYTSVDFNGCRFLNTNLKKVDFQGSVFTDCTFEGELREVLFYRYGFGGQMFPPNEMVRVDFTRANLRWCEFRKLDLDQVRFPDDEDNIVIDDYPETLDRLLQAFGSLTDSSSRQIAAVLRTNRKWVGPNQKRGILNKQDVLEVGGKEALQTVLRLIDRVN